MFALLDTFPHTERWKHDAQVAYLNCGKKKRYEGVIDHCSYAHNLSSCEIDAWKKLILDPNQIPKRYLLEHIGKVICLYVVSLTTGNPSFRRRNVYRLIRKWSRSITGEMAILQLPLHNHYFIWVRPPYVGGIWRRRFYSENALNFFPSTLRRRSLRTQKSPVTLK